MKNLLATLRYWYYRLRGLCTCCRGSGVYWHSYAACPACDGSGRYSEPR